MRPDSIARNGVKWVAEIAHAIKTFFLESHMWAASLFLSAVAFASPQMPPTTQLWDPNAIIWQEERPGGTKRTILEGDLKSPGSILTYAFQMPDGSWFGPHFHSTTSRVFVLKGVLLLGDGKKEDHKKVQRISAGQAVLVPGGLVHYEGAEGETIIVGVATGPWTTEFVK